MDLELLRSFVSVIDAVLYPAGERVHRTQSTVSQQIRRLEESFGRPLLLRKGKRVAQPRKASACSPMRGASCACRGGPRRRRPPTPDGIVRLGVPEDFAAYRLAQLLSKFARSRPGLRLDVRCDLSAACAAISRAAIRSRAGKARRRR